MLTLFLALLFVFQNTRPSYQVYPVDEHFILIIGNNGIPSGFYPKVQK